MKKRRSLKIKNAGKKVSKTKINVPQKKRVKPNKKSILERKQNHFFPVVGIGASAGGLEALKELFQGLPTDTGMAYVVIQHLDPSHESLAPEILSRSTKMPVREALNRVKVEPNHIYLIPPNTEMSILNGALELSPHHSGDRGQQLVIDVFFQSLARDQKSRAIGIILSGTASDGTEGLKAVKAEGGVTLVQDPSTAKYGGMPESAIRAGLADFILSPKGISQELARMSEHPYVSAICQEDQGIEDLDFKSDKVLDELKLSNDDADAVKKIFVILRNNKKVDFTHYKQSTILRRIHRRMMVRKCDALKVYLKYLQENPNEIQALYSDVLINVTEFFREPNSFKIIEEVVLPQIVKNREADRPIRIWVPGCSTGEEAYSLAIVLLEFLNAKKLSFPIQIFATDISEESIKRARAGLYPSSIESGVSRGRLNSFFDKLEGSYKVSKALRDLCLFSRHDITTDPPFSKIDIISCRNVLIYFSSVLQKRVIPIFHYALNPSAFLMLGKSESLGTHTKLFSLIDKTNRVFKKVNITTPMMLQTPILYTPEISSNVILKNKTSIGTDYQKLIDKLALEKFSPPSVIINSDFEIMQFLGRATPCLELNTGKPTHQLLKMLRPELVHNIRLALKNVVKSNTSQSVSHQSILVDGKMRTFNIEVIPLNPSLKADQRSYVVYFIEETQYQSLKSDDLTTAKIKESKRGQIHKSHLKVSELEEELLICRQSQVSLTEEFELAQEELTSANEELQSTNEELQSANEELETSKEELQSTNEELTTVNDELQSRNNDLIILSSDLNNFLNNVEIPVVIISSDFRIRRFTPNAEKVFNLITSDVGRPLTDINPNFNCDLIDLSNKAMKSLGQQESEITMNDGSWVRVQVRPYRTIDNRIDGAVISLIDITQLKKHLSEAQLSLKYASSVSDSLRLPLVVLDERFKMMSSNLSFSKLFDYKTFKEKDFNIYDVLESSAYKIPKLRELLTAVLKKNEDLNDFLIEGTLNGSETRKLLLNASKINWELSNPVALLLSLEDVTERKRLERSVQLYQERSRVLIDGVKDYAIFMLDLQGFVTSWNEGARLISGYSAEEVLGTHFRQFYTQEDVINKKPEEALKIASDLGRFEEEAFRIRKDRSQFWAHINITAMRENSGELIGFAIITKDYTELRNLFQKEKEARKTAELAKVEAELANATKDAFLATLSHELRTPLFSILLSLQLIQKESFQSKNINEALKTIGDSSKLLGQLIDDLLDVARIQSGKLSTSFKNISIRIPIEGALRALQFLAQEKSIKIQIKFNQVHDMIWADSERLQQVFMNLLSNAIKFSPSKSTVEIIVEELIHESNKMLSIKVKDYGEGIEGEYLPKLFKRYYQIDNSSTRMYGGLGLGLEIVRYLVGLHHGSVKAESEGLGQGSTFTVYLPLGDEVH
ncbi:MAG: PAS domain-containing protein [Proteobacteria bacterium]|nr:PAS domain-containing protein [Pseudomonadota bacterium]